MLKDVVSQLNEANQPWLFRFRTKFIIGLVIFAAAVWIYRHVGPVITRLLW